ncbi:hypothetical protein PQO03_13070 [Lentisphaera profundi]|uniref:Uncharacterized protein n=1 Tax=Lentisphaera profundi TaxID=1658616 RepID=A0ABY7VZT8_9BACT|nr:hypothetical protein [Lentisphaera profundi]WDE98768.1 hypothetical protein PQO03_13070 [Lentisphaera profundi]
MSNPINSFKILGFSALVLVLFISPIFFFDFQESLEPSTMDKNFEDEKTFMVSPGELGIEELDEDPRIIYMPDHTEGFSTWMKQEIDLPSLELPNMEIDEAEFYLEEDFPLPQNSLSLNLEAQIRADWPLPELEDDLPELELKKGLGDLLIFLDEEPVENTYYDDESLKLLFENLEGKDIKQVSMLRVVVENDEMQVDLVHSCGVRELENDFSRRLLKEFYKDKILSSITHKRGQRGVERSGFYLIEWRFSFSRLKNEGL